MSQITKDPLGNDVEVLSLTEWSGKNQKELSENTLNQYAGYATGQLLRAGKNPDEFQNNLYSGLFRKGVQEGVFQPQDEEQTKQLFENFANKPFVDDTNDLDLVSKNLLSVDPEQAARAADVYQRTLSGQPDASLEQDLQDVKSNIATPERIQQARIDFAKERGLAFIDYPTGEPGRRDVWINNNANPDRKAIYDTLDLAQGIVDPTSARLAEEWIKTDPGRTVNRYGQRENVELQSLIQDNLSKATPESGFRQNIEAASSYASEAAAEFGVSTDVTTKAPTEEIAGTKQVIATPAGAVYTEGTAKRVATNRVADSAIKAAYASLKLTDPNNPLVTDFSEDQFARAAKDLVLQRIDAPTNQDDPTKNFVTLTDGTRMPLASAAMLPAQKFNQALDTLGLDEKEKAAAKSIRTGWIGANIVDIDNALYDYDGDKYIGFVQENADKYNNDSVKLAEAYIDTLEPDSWKTFVAKAKGVVRSIPNSASQIITAVGGGASAAMGWKGAEEMFADQALAEAEQEKRRGTYVNLYGGELGLGYTLASQAAPLLSDILITKGAATATRAVAKPLIGTAVRTAEGLFGQSAKSFIGKALSEETKGLAGKYLGKFTVGGAEKSPAQVLRAVRRDLENKFVAGTATATQIGTSFTRSAQGAWVNTTLQMRNAKNEDGTAKFTEEEIKDAAFTNAMYSGGITAITERAFGKVFGEGADVTTIGNASIRQIKNYSKRLTGALERSGFGGQELYDTLKQVSREVVNEGWGDAIKQVPAEALEEFTDEFAQNVANNLLNDEQINFKQAFTQGLQAAVVGGVYGGAFGSANKIGLLQADIARDTLSGTAQAIERDLVDRTVAKLQESGGNPQTVAALQERTRVAQRRGQAISQSIPVRVAKNTIIEQLDALGEEPLEVPQAPVEQTTAPTTATATKLAQQLAKELAVNEEELRSIQPSGTDKQGAPQVTPNDVRAYVNRRTEQMGLELNDFLPGPGITAPEGGLQLIGADAIEDAENRTFDDLKNRVVVIDGLRGRIRVEDEGVILDPEDGSTPFEITPNKNLLVKEFEGFNSLLQEGAAVSPRRQAREVSEITEGGQVIYGDTSYDLPEQPLIANIKRDGSGNVESMHMRVYNNKGLATWVYVAGDNVPKVETAYRVRGPEAVTNLTNAVANATRETVRRNEAAQTFKAKQSKQRRKQKRAKNNAPLVTDRGQRAAESAPDYRVSQINQPNAPQQLVDEVRAVAVQLGIDPDIFTDTSELFAIVGPELAAGLDLDVFSVQQKRQAVENLKRNGNNPETLLEYLVSDELVTPQDRAKRDSNIAALRARNNNQLKKHGIAPGANIKATLESVARSASNKTHRAAAKELLRLGADTVPTAFAYLPNNIGTAGAYLPQTGAVVVNLASDNGEGALGALLHELGHAVTDRVLVSPKNDFEQQLRDKLLTLRAEYNERARTVHGDNMPPDLRYALEGRMYEFENFDELNGTRELVAHFYGSSKFREQLVKLSPKGERNFVQKFIDLIASLFSGQPAASKQYKELADAITELSNANQTIGANPYGRTVGRVAASRAGVNHQNKVGPLFGVPNPHGRADFQWVMHQVPTMRYANRTSDEINELIKTQKFGMFTGENPNAVEGVSEQDNIQFNKKAVQWLNDRGYEVIPIIGRYDGLGENSFLVPGLTDQDAVDASYELQQKSIVTDTGSYDRYGMFSPRVGEVLNQPVQDQDDYFSALLDSNGNVTTIRVDYDFDTTLDSGIRYSKQDQQAAPTTQIAKSLAAQGEFQVVEDREIGKPLQFVDGRLLVNPSLAEQRYAEYDTNDAADLQEVDARLAVAIGMANGTSGPEVQLDFEEVGLSPDSVIEQAAYNTLTNSDLQDLLNVKEQAKQFVASAYYHIAVRNDGSNERLATAQNRIADLYRYLLRDGAAIPEGTEKFNALDIGPVTTQLAERSKAAAPIIRYSRAAVDIKPAEVRARTKAGKAVGTRNPTSAKATEDGADPSNLVDLASLKRNKQAYRKNALLLLEYPIVAREFPKLAKEYAKIRDKVLKAQDKATANGIKIKGAKHSAKKILAEYLGVSTAKVSSKQLEDALENPESVFVVKDQPETAAGKKEAAAKNKALNKFQKAVVEVKKFTQTGATLGEDSSKALKVYSDTLDAMAKNPDHAIARKADEIYNTLIEVTKSNLRKLMDVFPADIREIANLWYDGANIIAQQFAGDNYSLEQSSAVLAVFSPQKDWFQNVELAKRTMEIWTADQEYGWDDAMSARWLMRGGEPELREKKDGTIGYSGGIRPDLDENGEHRTDENGMLLFHGWNSEKVKAKRQQAFERLQSLKGKKLKDLTPEQQAWFIRMRAETKYDPSYPIVSPDGRFGKPSKSTNNKGVTKEIKLAWGTYGSIGKAINILTAPPETQMKVISDELGDQHKVRSFYNNIVDPQNNDGHVTMDTHAIAALFWQAFSGNSREVGQNFGTANTATDSVTGVGGLYPAFAEAYRAVAAEYGMLPRQVQSITWEAVRMLFTARWKSKSENVNGVRAKWVQYQNNEISLDQAQNAVFAMATNGKDLATAVANSNDEQLGLGFPSWADVTEDPAPAGAGVALSRALPTQLDADYMKAVDAGDTAEMQRLVDEAAKAAGYTVGVFHGTSSPKDFTKFRSPVTGIWTAFYERGAEPLEGDKTKVLKLFANPGSFPIELNEQDYQEWRRSTNPRAWIKKLRWDYSRRGYKSSDDRNKYSPTSVKISDYALVVFNPSQVKSADPITYDKKGNVIPLSQRFDLVKPDIRYSRAAGADTAPKAFRGRTVQLTHWSKASGIKQTDPTEHGNGGAGKELERRREYGDIYMPRTYFGYGKYRRETQVGVNRYSMLVNGDSLYDLDRDPLDLYPGQDELQKAGYAKFDNRAALTLFEKAIKDAGYKGYVSTSYQAGVLFNKQNVTKVKDGDTSLPLAAPPSVAKSIAALAPTNAAEEKAASKATARRNSPELAVAAVRMIDGKITVDEYADLVEFFDPWEIKGAIDIPAVDKIKQFIDASKISKVELDVPAGTIVEARIDIPTYNRSTAAGDSVYAITLHQPAAVSATRVAAPLSYTNIARITGVTMVVRAISGKGEARDIAAGTGKFPLATVKGRVAPITELPADINDPEVWTEVGFNPVRSSDFVDVRSKLAVVGGSEAIMVGPRVFVRNAQFTERATGYMTDKSPRYSKAVLAVTSPDAESAYTVSLDDMYINDATGEWDAGGPVSRLFRAAGDIDPRLFEAAKYQERGLRLTKVRLKDLAQAFKGALKAEPNADLDDVNVALGSTEPTVSSAQRAAAESVKNASIEKANQAFNNAPANKAYMDAVNTARVNYATHRNKQKYTAEVEQARASRKNSPETQQRDAAIAAANTKYSQDIQAARAQNLVPVRRAQQQAQLRLEANSPKTALAVAELRIAIDKLSKQLSDELGPNNQLRGIVDQNIGIYLTRSYRIHQDEGYAQRVLEDSEFASQRAQARVFFEKQWVDNTYEQWRKDVAYEPYTDAEVMALVQAEATSKDVGTRELYKFVDAHGATPKTINRAMNRTDLTRFMQKGEVPAELRALLGEIQNPVENALRTYGNLAQFLGTQRLLNQYTKLGLENDWLVTAADVDNDPVKYRGYAPLVNTTDTKGGDPLSDYYAKPEVVEAFKTMFGPAPQAAGSTTKKFWDGVQTIAGRTIGASMGFLTLGSIGFYVRNVASIPIFAAANGFIPSPSNILTAFKGVKEIYGSDLQGLGADMLMLGVAEGSLASQTMRDFIRGVIEDPETVSNQIENMLSELSAPSNYLTKAAKAVKVTVDGMATLNDQIDLLYKAAYWAHEIGVQTKANKHRSVPFTPQQIKQEAARVVRRTTQGRERVAPIAKEFQRSGFGMLFNSFFRFTAEMYRLPLATIQQGMEEVNSGNLTLQIRGAQRLSGLGATLSILGYGAPALLKYMFKVDDDEEEAVRAAQPPWARDSNLFITSNPKDNSVSAWDLTYINGFSPVVDAVGRSIHHAVNGRWEKIPGVMFASLAKSFLSPQIAVEAMAQATNNTDDRGANLWLEDDPWYVKGSKFLKHVGTNAYKLRTPFQFWKAYQAYTNGGVYDKDARFETAKDLVVNEFMPFRVRTSKPDQLARQAFSGLKLQMDNARRTLGELKSYEQLDQERVDNVYDRYERSNIAINERLRKYSNGFSKLGMSYKQLESEAYDVGISKNRFAQAVKYGRVERYVPSEGAMDDYKKIGGESNGAARVQYIQQAIRKRPKYIPLND